MSDVMDEAQAEDAARETLANTLDTLPGGSKPRAGAIVLPPQYHIPDKLPLTYSEFGQTSGIPTTYNELQQQWPQLMGSINAGKQPAFMSQDLTPGPISSYEPKAQAGGLGTALRMGFLQLGQAAVGLAEMAHIDMTATSDDISQALAEDYQYLTPEAKAAIDAKWASLGSDSIIANPKGVLYQIVENLPMMAATMGIPVTRAAIVASAVGKELMAKGLASGMTEVAAREAARKGAAAAAAKAAALPGAVAEGSIDVGYTKQQAVDSINDMPMAVLLENDKFDFKGAYQRALETVTKQPATPEDLRATPEYQQRFKQLQGSMSDVDADVGARSYAQSIMQEASPENPTSSQKLLAQEIAKKEFRGWAVDHLGGKEALTAGAITAVFGAIGEGYLGHLMGGGAAKVGTQVGRAGRGLRGFGAEAGVEAIQNPQQAYLAWQAERQINPNAPMPDLAEQTLQGAGVGGIMGGAVGAISPGERVAAAPPAAAGGIQIPGAPPVAPAATATQTAPTGAAPAAIATPAQPVAAPPELPPAPAIGPPPEENAPAIAAQAVVEGAAAPAAVAAPIEPIPTADEYAAQIEALRAADQTPAAFSGFRQALVNLKAAYEAQYGNELPPISVRNGQLNVGKFLAQAAPIIAADVPDVVPSLTRALTQPDFAKATGQIETITAAIKNPVIELGKVGSPGEHIESQYARSRAKADQYAKLAGQRGKPTGVSLAAWAGAVSDMAVGLRGLMQARLQEGVSFNTFPSGITGAINYAMKMGQEAASPTSNVTVGKVRRAYNRLAPMASQVEQLKTAPTSTTQPATAVAKPAVAATPSPAPAAPTHPPTVAPTPPVQKTKGEAVKEKVAAKKATKKETQVALRQRLAEVVKKKLETRQTYAGKHGALMEHRMQEVQKVAAALGATEGKTKGEKVRAIINKLYPESPYEKPREAVPTQPVVKTTQQEAAPAPKPTKAVEIKIKGKRKTIAKAEGLAELVVQPRVMKQEGKTTALKSGFENIAEMRAALGENSPLLATLNQKDSVWAWAYGLQSALPPGVRDTLRTMEARYWNATTEDEALNAEFSIRALLANVEGKRVPTNVVEAVMTLTKAGREWTQQANLAREVADELSPGEAVVTPEDLVAMNAVELINQPEAAAVEEPTTTETPEQELARLMAEQQSDDTTQIEQELGYGQSIYGDASDNEDLNDYERQQSLYNTRRRAVFSPIWRGSAKFMNEFGRRVAEGAAYWAQHGAMPPFTVKDIVNDWLKSLPANDPVRPLMSALVRLQLNVPVHITGEENPDTGGEYVTGKVQTAVQNRPGGPYRPGPIAFDESRRAIFIWATQMEASDAHTLLHEISHAATSLGYETDAVLRGKIDALYRYAQMQAPQSKEYGFKNAHEFMVEALTNPEFQRLLAHMKTPPLPGFIGRFRSMLDSIVGAIKEFFGLPRTDTMLEAVLTQTKKTFRTEEQIQAAHGTLLRRESFGDLQLRKQQTEKAIEQGRVAQSKLMQKLKQTNYGFMDGDFMERKVRSIFDQAAKILAVANPVHEFMAAAQRAEAYARDLGLKAAPIVERFMKLPEAQRNALFQVELDSTLNDVHADLSLKDPANAHLFDKKGHLRKKYQATVPGIVNAYRAMSNPEQRALYTDMKNMLQEVYWRKRQAALESLAERYGLPQQLVAAFGQLRTEGDLIAFGNQHAATTPNVNEVLPVAENIFKATRVLGPYFPLRREGDWVVSTVDKKEKFVRFVSSEREAKQLVSAMQAAGRDVVYTQKITQESLPGATSGVVRSLVAKIKDSDIRQRVHDAVVSMMSDNILYGSTLRRRKIKGVDPKIMGKAFEDYIKSSMGFIGNIETANAIDHAMIDLNVMQSDKGQALLRDGGMSEQHRIEIGYINNELKLRNEEFAADRHVGNIEAKIGQLGFFNYLAAPSYWLLNATQAVIVGTPYLAGRHGVSYTRATIAMRNAYKTLLAATKGGGVKALMDLETVVSKMTPAQQTIVRKLIEDNIIGSTIANEFGRLVASARQPIWNKVNKIVSTAPEMIERLNRLSVALASIELGGDYQKAKDSVQATQFNYSAHNRARLLKYLPKWAGGGARPIVQMVMMFKVYGVNMARLLYGNMYDALRGETPAQRAEARKVLAGLVMAHTLFGGVYGGLGMGLAQVIGGAINAMLKPEDRFNWGEEVQQFLAQHTNDYIANVITRGAPASVGVDMSNSINLGNLLWMSKDTNLSEPGGAETAFASAFGPIGQYGMNAVRTSSKWVDGTASTAQMLSAITPVKLLSSLARTYDQAYRGLNTSRNQQFMQPGEVSVPDMIIGALGLKPVSISQRQQTFYAARDLTQTLETRKQQLMASFAAAQGVDRIRSRQEITAWNRDMASRGNRQLVISADNLAQSQAARREAQQQYGRGQYTKYR